MALLIKYFGNFVFGFSSLRLHDFLSDVFHLQGKMGKMKCIINKLLRNILVTLFPKTTKNEVTKLGWTMNRSYDPTPRVQRSCFAYPNLHTYSCAVKQTPGNTTGSSNFNTRFTESPFFHHFRIRTFVFYVTIRLYITLLTRYVTIVTIWYYISDIILHRYLSRLPPK